MHRSLASPLLAAASGAVAASLGSSRATSFTEGSGRVGVILDDESAAKLHQRFPQRSRAEVRQALGLPPSWSKN